MPPRRPPTDVHLLDFLSGVLAVLALKGTTRVAAEAGVLDAALHETLRAIAPIAERLKVRPRFRLAANALDRPNSNLSVALARLEREGTLRRADAHYEILLSAPEAYVDLEALPFPLGYAERAAKTLLKRVAFARVRRARPRAN